MYTRAQGVDYDRWKTPGWTATDIIPLCNKVETYHDDDDPSKSHGHEGPIHISNGGFISRSGDEFLETVKQMGMEEIADINDFGENNHGFSVGKHTQRSFAITLMKYREYHVTCPGKVEDKMLHIVTSILSFKMATTQISKYFSSRRSSELLSITQHHLALLELSTKVT
jgi:hypothetical protein